MSVLITAGTFSKDPTLWGFEPGLAVVNATGSKVQLSDGKWYLDWVSGLGTNLCGYRAFTPKSFVSPSLPHSLEYTVADMLATMLGNYVPGWQPAELGVRFCKCGSDATTMAVRLARAVTGRYTILCFHGHYHGWHDWTIERSFPAWGVLDAEGCTNTVEVEWGDKFDANLAGIAAVIFEQPAYRPEPGWYDFLRQWCDDHGALLIADEVVTGLRYGSGGACQRYEVKPDLVCMGKALGNGLPLAALVGRREYMEWFARNDPVFCSSTTWGETASLSVAKQVLEQWDEAKVAYLWATGMELMHGLQRIGWDVFGHGARSVLRFKDDHERAFFIHGMRDRGVLINRPNFPCMAHTMDDVRMTLEAADEVWVEMNRLGEAEIRQRMKGKLPKVLFRGR